MLLSQNKKAVSIMIGYVMLISFAIIIGVLVYSWMKTYVPTETIECPDGVSVFIRDLECSGTTLNLSLTNNGRFSIDGYLIKATESPEQELATKDISEKIIQGGQSVGQGIVLLKEGFSPGEKKQGLFELDSEIYSVEITPIRYEIIEEKNKLVICNDAKISEKISCD